MNPNTMKSFDRMLDKIERKNRRPAGGRFLAAIVLGASLVVAQLLLAWFVPMVWEVFLPGGLGQAEYFDGWPAHLWRLAVDARRWQKEVCGAIAGGVALAFFVGRRSVVARFVIASATVAVVLFDIAVVVVTLAASYLATADAADLPGL